jgi:biotin/methionine sulfoxide reductase
MIGQVGLPGGGFGFGYGSINGMGTPRRHLPTPTMEEGFNPIEFSIPVARVSDLLLRPGDEIEFNGKTLTFPKIELVYWAGGNPFHHHQDTNKLLEAWSKPETVIVHEPWWTATARRADIVLPATTPFEREDLGASPRDRFIMAMPQIIPPVGNARNDYDIFAALADRLGFRQTFTEGRDIRGWVEHAYNVCSAKAAALEVTLPSFSEFWDKGYVEIPRPLEDFVLFADFRADPERYPLNTPSGKIEIYSDVIADFGYSDCPGHPCWIEPKEWLGSELATRFPLHLLSSQPATRLHGQLDDGLVSRLSKIKGREPLRINPLDARLRGIANDTVVRIYNTRGSCLAGAVVTDSIRPGVLDLATGAWFDPVEPDVNRAMDKHGNPNVLTRDEGTSRLGQGPSAHSCLVEVERWDEPLPEITAYEQPAMAAETT